MKLYLKVFNNSIHALIIKADLSSYFCFYFFFFLVKRAIILLNKVILNSCKNYKRLHKIKTEGQFFKLLKIYKP